MKITRLLPPQQLAIYKKSASSVAPTNAELIKLTALILDEQGQPVGAGIDVTWHVDPPHGGAAILFFDENKHEVSPTETSTTSQTKQDGTASIWIGSIYITIADISVAIGAGSAQAMATLVFHDPDPNAGDYASPFLWGVSGILNIPVGIVEPVSEYPELERLQSDLGPLETRYATVAKAGFLSPKIQRYAYILNNKLISVDIVNQADEATGYIPYCQMYSDGITQNSLKFIMADANGKQSLPLFFLAAGMPYQEPNPANIPNIQLSAPQFKGSAPGGILTADSLVDKHLPFFIPPLQGMNPYDQIIVYLYLDGWSPPQGVLRVTRGIPIPLTPLTAEQIKNGIDLPIASYALQGFGAHHSDGTQYGDFYLSYTINDIEYSEIYYSLMDFSEI